MDQLPEILEEEIAATLGANAHAPGNNQ